MRIPRIPPMCSFIAAAAGLAVLPYYVITGQAEWAFIMVILVGCNLASGCGTFDPRKS